MITGQASKFINTVIQTLNYGMRFAGGPARGFGASNGPIPAGAGGGNLAILIRKSSAAAAGRGGGAGCGFHSFEYRVAFEQ